MIAVDGGTVYIGRGNTVDWRLIEDGQPLSAERALAIARARLELQDGTVLDSADDPDLVSGLGTDTLSWRLGGVAALAPLRGRRIAVRLVVFAPDHPAGLVWADGIQVAVR